MQTQPTPLTSEERLILQTQLIHKVEQALVAVDLGGRIVFWNRFSEMLYGWTMEQVQGRNIDDLFATPLLMAAVRENLEQLRRGEDWLGEFPVYCRDNSVLMSRFRAYLIQSEPRTLIGIFGLRDDTEHQQLKEANRLLAEASALLTDAVDYETPLITLAKLAVPQLADWCAVHILQPDGSIEQVAIAPPEKNKQQAADNWLQNHLPKDDIDGLPAVLRSGEPKLITDVAADLWAMAAEIKSYMIVPLVARPQTFGAITFVAAESGRHFDLNALALAENLVSHIAIYLDKAHLYRESQQLNAELEQRVSERTYELSSAVSQLKQSEATIQTLFRISKKLNSTLDVDTILDELAQEAIQIVDGESGFAGLRTAKGMSVIRYFLKGRAIPFQYTWLEGQGIPGWVLKNKIPYGTSDAAHDPLIQHDLSINSDIRSIICTPILDSSGGVLAYFDIRNKQNGQVFTISDQEMLMALAPAASIAIQNALAYQQHLAAEVELIDSSERYRALAANLELVREEERTQIARELHDQLGQALTAMKYDLAWVTERLVQKDEVLAPKARVVTAQMDTMIKTVRRIATELRPGMLDDLGLAASIEWQAHDFEKRTGIVCDVSVPAEELLLTRALSVALFRIFQESLTNVARHASAQHIEVSMTATSEVVMLTVHDDGIGIKTLEITGRHSLGLLGMRERAMRLGGNFTIQAVPEDGTIVRVTIPINLKE